MSNPFRIQSAIFFDPDNKDNQQCFLPSSYRPRNLPDLPDLDLYHHIGFKAYMKQLQEHIPSNSPDPLSLESNHPSDDVMLLHFINNALSL